MMHWNPYGIFLLGFFFGFVLASFLISWYAQDHEKENKRLRLLIEHNYRELKIAQRAAAQKKPKSASPNTEFDP
jgi:hypothetical protein